MNYKILASDWYTPPVPSQVKAAEPDLCIGIVAIQTRLGWKAYIGFGLGTQGRFDEQMVAGNGMKIDKEVACAYFPQLPPEGFVY